MLLLALACSPASEPDPTDEVPGETGETGDTGAPFFEEPFDTLDDARWTAADWTLGATRLVADHAMVVDGDLELLHEADGDGGWLGAELYTGQEFSGGRWEATMLRPAPGGTVCATFFYGSDVGGRVNEIDIELLEEAAWFSVYRDWTEADGYEPSATHDSVQWPFPADFDHSVPHVYRIDWGETTLTFAVDGVEVGSLAMVPSAPIPLHVNHWTSTTWPDVAYPPPDRLVCRIEAITGSPLP